MKKKIFILVNTLSYLISHRLEIVIAAKENGYLVRVGYGELGNADSKFLTKKGIECVKVKIKPGSINLLNEVWSLFSIWNNIYQFKPDIVHLITIKSYIYGSIVARLTKVPGVLISVAGLGMLASKKKRWSFLKKIIYPLFYLAFNHSNQIIIFQNLHDKKKLINWINFDSKKTVLIPGSGVNINNFTNLAESNSRTTVCFASRLLYDKGVLDFASAARIILKKKIKANFLLAGSLDPHNRNSLALKDLRKITKEKIVKVLGHQKDIPALYARSHIICLPSFYGEGVPKTLIEAAAASRAIVTTDTPGCRDAIIPNKTGLLVPINKPEKLANAIQFLIENPKKRIEMGKAGRKLAKKKFLINKIVKNHLELYQKLLKIDKN